MKKLFLVLLLGMFLISFASAQVLINNGNFNTTRFTPEVELYACASDQLDADTTYYVQFFVGGYIYDGEGMSVASNEASFTTNSTHRCANFTNMGLMCDYYGLWDPSKGVHGRWAINRSFFDWGGAGYMPWSFNNNGTGTDRGCGYNDLTCGWMARYGNPGVYFKSEFKCSNNKDSVILDSVAFESGTVNIASYMMHHPEIAISLEERNRLSETYNVTKGVMEIAFVSGNSTWDDLGDALYENASSDMYVMSSESLSGLMTLAGTDAITFSGKTITIINGDFYNTALNFDEGTTVQVSMDINYVNHWFVPTGDWNGAKLIANKGQAILDTLGNTNDMEICIVGTVQYNSWNGLDFKCGTSHQSRYFNDGDYGYNGRYYDVYEYHTPNCATGVAETVYFENLTFYKDTTWDIYNVMTFCDDDYPSGYINYDMKNVISEYRSDKRPVHYYAPEPEGTMNVTQNYTYHGDVVFKVLMENGTLIENANVTAISDYGTWTGLTDSNGEVVLDLDFYKVYWNASNPSYYASTQELGDYNLTITATNFETYDLSTRIDTPEEWTIALKNPSQESTNLIIAGEIIKSGGQYPYINYEISPFESSSENLIKPYIVESNEE